MVEKKQNNPESGVVSGWIYFAPIIILLLVIAYYVFDVNPSDKVEFDGEHIVFTEAKCLFGSIFNKDKLVLADDYIEIISNSLLNKKKMVLPYASLKGVEFSKAYNGYKIEIEYPGSIISSKSTFYFNDNVTFSYLKSSFKIHNNNRCIVKESY